MAGTGLIGLVPTFRTLLIVHLFLVDAFLAYVALLAHLGDRRARRRVGSDAAPAPEVQVGHGDGVAPVAPLSFPRRRAGPDPVIAGNLPPVAATG